jgi:hypothetical protein
MRQRECALGRPRKDVLTQRSFVRASGQDAVAGLVRVCVVFTQTREVTELA